MSRPTSILTALLCAFALFAFTAPEMTSTAGAASTDATTVTVAQGTVHGAIAENGRQWLGLPYAAPPVGALRWQPPASAASWTGIRDATQHASACLQATTEYEQGRGSEDCLYLDIYAPGSTPPTGSLPVIVWMHGGGFVNGSGTEWDGARLAATADAIVVSINYRLGPFGWLALDSLSAEQNGASGDYGLMDQVAALKWVKADIAGFGGDPGDVTLTGQSAGGESVLAQMASPAAAGLFQRAISLSAPTGLKLPTLAEASQTDAAYATSLGCTDAATQAACLRAVPADQALAAAHESWNLVKNGGLTWTPVVGVSSLPDQWLNLFNKGTFNKVPVVIGDTRDEGQLFTAIYENVNSHAMTDAEYNRVINQFAGAAAPLITAVYNPVSYGSPSGAMSAVLTDMAFACGQQRVRDALAEHGAPGVYSYEFTDPNAFEVNVNGLYTKITDAHDSDLPFIFQYNPGTLSPHDPPFSTGQRILADQMGEYWGAFARTGTPNAVGLPYWPTYVSGTAAPTQSLTPPTARPLPLGDYYSRHNCAMWIPLLDITGLI